MRASIQGLTFAHRPAPDRRRDALDRRPPCRRPPDPRVSSAVGRRHALFFTHGAPTFALRPGAAGAALERVARAMPRPRAIVLASAHWETATPAVGFASTPPTVHDSFRFPAELDAIPYPARGAPELAERVARTLEADGLVVTRAREPGLDHGARVPLQLMYPDADVPVVPLSIQPQLGPAHHLRVGRALASLAAQDVLVVGPGSITHNLDHSRRTRHASGAPTPAYVHAFADWVADRLAAGDVPALLDYRTRAPGARDAHPTDEHLRPLFTALGAAGMAALAQRLYSGIDDHVIAMDAYAFHVSASAGRR